MHTTAKKRTLQDARPVKFETNFVRLFEGPITTLYIQTSHEGVIEVTKFLFE